MTGPHQLTGKRRVAFASYVDENYLPGFLVLLRSLVLSNPGVCEDFIVLHDDDLRPTSVSAIRRLHPRVVLRRVDSDHYDTFAKGDTENYLVSKAYFLLDAFRIRDYDTVITLDTDMVVLGDISELLTLRTGLAAVPQFLHGQHKLNSGLLVIQREYLTDEFCARLDAVGRAGSYELDMHDQGILNAVLDGDFRRLDPKYNFVKRRLSGAGHLPEEVAILHFTGRHKPWTGGEVGYTQAEKKWHEYAMTDGDFQAALLATPGTRHPDLVVHLGRQLLRNSGDPTVARAVAAAYLATGHYQEAADTLSSVRLPVRRAGCHELLGTALMSVSRYDEAEAHLLFATADPGRAARAFGRLAQLAWTRNDDAAAHRYALAGLSVDPLDRMCRIQYQRTQPGAAVAEAVDARKAPKQLAHVAFYTDQQGNVGDKVLPYTVRSCFDPDTGPRRWHAIHAHRLFDEAALEQVNTRRGLVVGGGGLFIPDTAPNGNSVWQWNVPDPLLERIIVPLVVFAVGYNAFDGQSYRARRFRESLRLLVSQAAFVGLRNHGSIERVRSMLPAELQDRVVHQPCPTTVTRQLVPGWRDPERRDDTILINCAYDRAALRFGHDYEHVLGELAKAVRALGRHGEVQCVAHSLGDERIVYDLRRAHAISLPVVPMYDYTPDQIYATYARTRLVIGMRGHAGMIPFGCGTPIISLVSHPKMAYFLTDISRPQWGISVHDLHLGDKLAELAAGLLDDHAAAVADVHERQQELWRITQDNMAKLKKILGGASS